MSALAYLGWHGRGNVGDDAIHDGVAAAMAGVELVDAPLYPRDALHALRDGRLRGLRAAVPFLGGGTCIGRANWRVHVLSSLALARGRPAACVGAGVEDPTFVGRHSFSGPHELARWARVLRRFERVSVRGPRSAELLADVGVDVVVAGDPALALARPTRRPVSGRIGVNAGFGDDLWGHDPERAIDVVTAVCRALGRRGHQIVGIAVNQDDRLALERILVGAGLPLMLESPPNAAAAAAAFGSCETVIAMRLHAGILAALAGTPLVALEYQPKCRDFARSIGNEPRTVRIDRCGADDVTALVAALADGRAGAAEASRLSAAVDDLRRRLDGEFEALRARLGVAQRLGAP